MAVQATQFNPFIDRETTSCLINTYNPGSGNINAVADTLYGNQTGVAVGSGAISMLPWPTSLSATAAATSTATSTLLMDPPNTTSLPPRFINGGSGNVSFVPPGSRKRSRDPMMLMAAAAAPPPPPPPSSLLSDVTVVGMQKINAGVSNSLQQCVSPAAAGGSSFSPLAGDTMISLQMMQHQFEMDRLISSHAEKVRLEVLERRKVQTRRVVAAIEAAVATRLRDKEQEVIKIGRVNQALEEKVKSLSMENQIWREIAQTNEATANALRSNLERFLSTSSQQPNRSSVLLVEEFDEAESCCGSSGDGGGENDGGGSSNRMRMSSSSSRIIMCRKCGMVESSVLLLPCRHLCVCTGCGSAIDACPVCNSAKSASVQVNFS